MFAPADTFRFEATTYNSSGALANADSTPAGVLVVNGTDTGTTVTITNASTGIYKGSCALSGLVAGDVFYVRITATVGGVTDSRTTATHRVGSNVTLLAGISLSISGASGNVVFVRGETVATANLLPANFSSLRLVSDPEVIGAYNVIIGGQATGAGLAKETSITSLPGAIDAALTTSHGSGPWTRGGAVGLDTSEVEIE